MDSVPLLHYILHSAGSTFPFVLWHYSGTAQPQSNTAFLELFHPSATQGALAQRTASSSARWRTSVCLDTREPTGVSLLLLSDNRKPQVPSPRIKLCAQPKHTPGWDRSERNRHSHGCRLPPLPLTHSCLLLVTSGISHLPDLQHYTLEDRKSLGYRQPSQELYRCL